MQETTVTVLFIYHVPRIVPISATFSYFFPDHDQCRISYGPYVITIHYEAIYYSGIDW